MPPRGNNSSEVLRGILQLLPNLKSQICCLFYFIYFYCFEVVRRLVHGPGVSVFESPVRIDKQIMKALLLLPYFEIIVAPEPEFVKIYGA